MLTFSTLFTLVVGLLIVLTGKLGLARYIQMLPLSVVGGYLGYIGYFCIAAGLSLATGENIQGVASLHLLLQIELLPRLIAVFAVAALLVIVSHRFKSDLLMPTILVAIPVLFFLVVLIDPRFTVAKARAWGWLAPEVPVSSFPARDAWALFKVGLVEWSLLPSQLLRGLGLFVVVTFGSSLDIAAIEAGVRRPLDYNRELCTVGFANVLAGIVGGASPVSPSGTNVPTCGNTSRVVV